MLEAPLFDLDGTLAESDPVHFTTWANAPGPHGVAMYWEAYGERIDGRSNLDATADSLPPRRENARPSSRPGRQTLCSARARWSPCPASWTSSPPPVRSSGLRLVPVTDAPKDDAYAVLCVIGLRDAFDETVLSEEVGAGKPDPAPYRAALARLGVAAGEAVAFEDSASGIASTPAAGVPIVGVASAREPEALKRRGAGPAVADFTDPALADPLDGR